MNYIVKKFHYKNEPYMDLYILDTMSHITHIYGNHILIRKQYYMRGFPTIIRYILIEFRYQLWKDLCRHDMIVETLGLDHIFFLPGLRTLEFGEYRISPSLYTKINFTHINISYNRNNKKEEFIYEYKQYQFQGNTIRR